MAITGTINGTDSKSWKIKIDYSYTQNTTANTSSVTLTLSVYNNNSAYNSNTNQAYYVINGTKTYHTYSFSSTKAWHELGSKTVTVNHNADGTGSLSVSGQWHSGISGSSYTPADLYVSAQTLTLQTIPRASKITKTNLNNTSNYIGSSLTIGWTAGSSSFTHTLKYKMSGQSSATTIASSITAGTASKAWTIPTSFYALCPNASSLAGTLYLYTYSGSTQVGSDSASFTVYVKEADNKPTITVTLTDTNTTTSALTGSNSRIIKGYSNIKVVCAGTGVNSATIASNNITYNGSTSTATTASQTKTYTAVATGTFKGSVTDSRGFTTTSTPSTTLISYFKPSITLAPTMSITSTTSNTAQAVLNIATTSYSGNFGAQSNSITVQYRYKVSGGSYSSYANATAGSGGAYSATITGLDGTKTYYFQAKIVDKLETVTTSEIKASALPVFDFDADDFNFNVAVTAPSLKLAGFPVPRYSGYDYSIAESADLNSTTFCKVGRFACTQTARAKTLSNTPWGSQSNSAKAFMLTSYLSNGGTSTSGTYVYLGQELRPYDSGAVYYRLVQCGATAGVWTFGTWKLYNGFIEDRVIERGVTGDWRWRKWANGDFDCWYCKDTTFPTSISTSLGIENFYVVSIEINLPITFVEPPSATCSIQWGFSEWVQCQSFTNKIRVRKMGNGNSIINMPTQQLSIQVQGRWA